MPPKRKRPHQTTTTSSRSSILKPSQRFITAKSGKLSKTNLQTLFTSPDLWAELSALQQLQVLTSLRVHDLFGEGHPQKLGSGKYLNYFTALNPLSTRVSPSPSDPGRAVVEQASEVYFDMTSHLEKFREDLREGRFDPKWMVAGEKAALERGRGDFDGLWQLGTEEDGKLGDGGLARVAEVKRKRLERIARGEE